MRSPTCLLLLGACTVGWGQNIALSTDSRFAIPVDESIKVATLKDAIKQIGKDSGTSLDVVSVVSDLKVTCYCKHLTEGILLDKIADALGLIWTDHGSFVRIGFDHDLNLQMLNYVEAEDRLLRSLAEDQVSAFAEGARMSVTELDSLPKANRKSPRAAMVESVARNGALKPWGFMFSAADAAQMSAFWRGDVLTRAPTLRLPDGQWTNNESARVYARYDPYLMFTDPELVTEHRAKPLIPYLRPPDPLAALPFAKRVLAWPKPLTEIDAEAFNGAVKPIHREKADPRPTLADQLEAFFKQTGMPVVAEAFRAPVDIGPLDKVIGTDWLTRMTAGHRLESKYNDGVLEFRHGGFWRLRRFEIPEKLLSQIELKATKEAPELSDYVTFLAQLTPIQAAALQTDDVALAFDQTPYHDAFPALWFLAALGSDVLQSSGIPAFRLAPTDQAKFVQAGLWGAMKGKAKGSIVRPLTMNDLRDMGVACEDKGDSIKRHFSVLIGKSDSDGVVFTTTATQNGVKR